ncbi:unnamed protein product [Didymodactylos carnosus]|nr:unnamed protein product [Didymodactylos carnosus]CAF3939223.1 unnamed protein product [Didymodactylos carnosus]
MLPCSREQFINLSKKIRIIGDFENFKEGDNVITCLLNSECKLQVHYPPFYNNRDNNRNSLIAIIYFGKNKEKIVLTGDQSFDQINGILEEKKITETSIFQIPHHGSQKTYNDYDYKLIPSRVYIISGKPENDENTFTDNRLHNITCQYKTVQHIIETTKTQTKRIYVCFTQLRLDENSVKILNENYKITVVGVNTELGYIPIN